MKKHNKKYAKRMTKHQKRLRSQLIVLIAFMLAIGIIGHASLKQPYSVDLTPKTALTGHLPENKDKTNPTVAERIRIVAAQKNFQWPDYLVKLAQCESSLDPLAIGDQGNSRGLFQIHKKYHPEVSTLQAFNIEYSTAWTIDMINRGEQHQWSCNKIILARK